MKIGHKPLSVLTISKTTCLILRRFGCDVDYAMLIKLYGNDSFDLRYSSGDCIGTQTAVLQGSPDTAHISTSFIERQNLTMRMQIRRFTRLTNAFSKKMENHESAVALHFMHYNFCRIHKRWCPNFPIGSPEGAEFSGGTPQICTTEIHRHASIWVGGLGTWATGSRALAHSLVICIARRWAK